MSLAPGENEEQILWLGLVRQEVNDAHRQDPGIQKVLPSHPAQAPLENPWGHWGQQRDPRALTKNTFDPSQRCGSEKLPSPLLVRRFQL